jgi:pimeloyl-ACP methyl ester carboxylesterase
MTTFVCVPGAGGAAWYWHRVVPLLEEAGHEAIAVDLPGDDGRAGLSAYADRILEAIGARQVVLVVQSLGGFTAPLVCARIRVRMLVFVNAMIPVPGETAGEWWDNTEAIAARIAAAERRTSSTTSRPRSSSRAPRTIAPRPTSCSASRADSEPGPTFRPT